MNVLIVEDDKLTLTALQHCIESLGHHSFLALESIDAIRNVRNFKIDFIFSDILMPGISGLSLVSIMRNVYLIKAPIILISTMKTSVVRNASEFMGADDFIEKPFTIADLAYKITKYTSPELKNH